MATKKEKNQANAMSILHLEDRAPSPAKEPQLPKKADEAPENNELERNFKRFTIPLAEDNYQYLKNIQRIDDKTIGEILDMIIMEHRSKKEEPLKKALQKLEEEKKSWLEE